MRILIKILFIIVILIFEFFMFQISLEIGAVSLVLIIATFCIGFVLNKITTVVEQPRLVLSSEPFRDSSKHADNKTKFDRSEEHTSELQSLVNLVCRLLLEKKKKIYQC